MAELLPHQQRVVEEKKELDGKLEKLKAFVKTEIFETLEFEDKSLLNSQVYHMYSYSDILKHRILRFQTRDQAKN